MIKRVLLPLLCVFTSQAETELCGDIGSITYESSGNPFVVRDSIVILQGKKSTFNSGCIILLHPYSKVVMSGSFDTGASFVMGAENVALYAKWLVNQHVVTFDSLGGGSVPAQIVNHDDTVALPPSPNKPGYKFIGWSAQESGSTLWNFSADTVVGNVVLYARWAVNSYTVIYLGYGATSGTSPASTTNEFGTTVTVAANAGLLTRTGFTFIGWGTSSNNDDTL